MKIIPKIAIAVAAFLLCMPMSVRAETSYTLAILPFSASGNEFNDLSQEVPILLNAYLSANPSLVLVERNEVDKALSEVELGMSGTVDPETAARVGHLTGAQILVTGRVFAIRKELVFVAKIVGVETGRVYGETITIPIKASITEASQGLADKISSNILEKGDTLIAKIEEIEDIILKLKKLTEGKTLPSVSVSIQEDGLNDETIDPAAETEISHILQKAGFEIIALQDSKQTPDIEISGEAFSEFAMRKGNLVSVKARIEIKVLDTATKDLLLIDRAKTVAVELSPEIAGKDAITKGAASLTEAIVKAIINRK